MAWYHSSADITNATVIRNVANILMKHMFLHKKAPFRTKNPVQKEVVFFANTK